jgi:hypothetical protein
MATSQWIISSVVGVFIFLIAYYVGQTTFLLALLCGVIELLGNIFVVWQQKFKNEN